MPLEPGTELGRYTIEGILGEGAMGTVYRAFDARLRRAVAVKVLAPPAEGEEEAVAATLREARAAAAILHPNATAVFDADRVGEMSFIVMELVPGTSLRRFVGDASVPMGTRVRWLAEIGSALAAAHEAGVVHRDVKPENVIVGDDGLVKVLDFGIARVPRSSLETPGAARTLLGTPAYMAPEHVRGEEIDGRADQFGWGVLAYELLAGRLPWAETGDPVAQIASVLRVDPAPLPIEPALPPEVAAAVLRALAKAPGDRFPSMVEAVEAIVCFASRRALHDPPPVSSCGFRERIAPSAVSVLPPPSAISVLPPPSARPLGELPPWARTLATGASGRAISPDAGPSPSPPALREPDFSASVDVDAHLALLPPGATCKGLFFIDLLKWGAAAATPDELARLAGVPERRYVAFRDYPMVEHVRLGVAVALALYPGMPLGVALRFLGQRAFDTVSTSLVGRTLLGGFGCDLEPLLFTGPRAYRLFLNFGEIGVEQPAPRRFVFHVRDLPGFLETYQVGVIEGVLRHCGESARVRIALEALDRATLSIELL